MPIPQGTGAVNTAGYMLQLDRAIGKVQAQADAAVRKIEFEIARRVILRTPVDTGAARGNWICAIGSMPMGYSLSRVSPSGRESTSLAFKTAQGSPGAKDHVFWIINHLPYIIPLEYGHSKQAPSGMVRPVLAQFRALVADVATVSRSGP